MILCALVERARSAKVKDFQHLRVDFYFAEWDNANRLTVEPVTSM